MTIEEQWVNKILLYDSKIKFVRINNRDIGKHQQNGLLKIEMVYSRGDNRGSYYFCKCDCGNYTTVWGAHFRTEHSKSCGCYAKEKSKENMYKLIEKKKEEKTFYKDLTNQTHDWLVAIKPTEKINSSRQRIWLCKCLLCGTLCEKDSTSFFRTSSCGCLNQSKGVKKIELLLQEYNIFYEKEKRFEDCKDILPLPFDFYINNYYIIEYDGIQHFKDIQLWGGKDKMETRKKHDEIKNEYCKNKNIPLIRIPYTHFEKICLEDLLLETSNFIIN